MKAIDDSALSSDDGLSSSDKEEDEAPYQTMFYESTETEYELSSEPDSTVEEEPAASASKKNQIKSCLNGNRKTFLLIQI